MRRDLRRSATACLALALLASAAGAAAGAPSEPTVALRRELVAAVEGGPAPVRVTASPALCAALGLLRREVEEHTPEWYFAEGYCEPEYPPRLGALVTVASLGVARRLVEQPALRERVAEILGRLRELARSPALGLEDRLLIHTTAWELAHGLSVSLHFNPDYRDDLDPVVCRALALVAATRFTPEEAQRLPANLHQVGEAGGSPGLAETVAAIARRDESMVEIGPISELHAEQLLGRFTARIFFTVAGGEEERARFRTLAAQGPFLSNRLRKLHYMFKGVRGVLVLYFNVLTADYEIIPTEHVASYQQYTFAEQLVEDMPFEVVAPLVDFVVVDYEVGARPEGDGAAYRVLPDDAVALQGFLNVKPQDAGRAATTLHGQCLKCHSYQIPTFNTHQPREVRLDPPLERRGRELLSGLYHRFENRLQEWAAQCPAEAGDAGGEPTAPAARSAPDRGAAPEDP